MIQVSAIASDAKRFLANCDDQTLFDRLNHVVELLANESDWDPLVAVVDVPTVEDENLVSLPREVETPLSVNIGRRPALARDRFFSFHLNGPGDECKDSCNFAWDDKGDFPTLVSPKEPVQVSGVYDDILDQNTELWVYGYDANGRWIRTQQLDGGMADGYLVPLFASATAPDPGSPFFARIVRVRKADSRDYVQLRGYESGDPTGVLLGDYAHDENEPSHRRIRLSRTCRWARIIFRRKIFKITSLTDLIPLHSPFAVLMALKALQKMEDDQLDEGDKYLARAVEMLTKEQLSRNPLAHIPVQVGGPQMLSGYDRLE